MQDPDVSLAQVAAEAGFADHAHLTRSFRQEGGRGHSCGTIAASSTTGVKPARTSSPPPADSLPGNASVRKEKYE
jgi:hypothetical protein